MANQQQFLSSHVRLTGPSRPLGTITGLAQHMGGGLARTGTGSMGGAVGTIALASGLEELKRTADHWMQDQQATHQRNELMSTKLKEQEKINQALLKEKEKLQETIQELKARVREDAKHVQTVLDRLQFVEGVHNGLLQSVGKTGEELHKLESKRSAIEVAINNQGELCGDIEGKYGELLTKQQATEQQLSQASAACASLHIDLEAAKQQVAALEQMLSTERQQHDALKESASITIRDLTTNLNTAHETCAAQDQEMATCARHNAAELMSLQEAHTSSINELEEQLRGKQQQLDATQQKLLASETQLAELHAIIQVKQEQNKELEHQLERAQGETTKATETLCELEKQLEAQQLLSVRKQEELRLAQVNLDELSTALQSAQSEKESLSREAAEVEVQLKEAQQGREGMASRVTDLEAALQALNQERENIANELEQSKALSADLQQQLQQRATSIAELQQLLAANATEKEQLGKEADEARSKLAAEIEQLISAQATASEEAAVIQQGLNSLQAEHTKLAEEKAAMEERAAEINQQLEAANAATAEAQLKALHDVNGLKEQLAKERTANRKNTENVAKRMEEISSRASKADELTKEVALLRAQLLELQSSKAEVEALTVRMQEQHAAEMLKQMQEADAAAKVANELAVAKLTEELAAAAAASTKQFAEAEAAALERHREEIVQVQAAAEAQKQQLSTMLQDAIHQVEELRLAKAQDTEQISSITEQLLGKEVILQKIQASSVAALGGLQQQLDQQLRVAAEMEAMLQERESEATELRGEVSELKKSMRLLEQSCEEAQASLAEKEEILLNITSIGRKGLMGQVNSRMQAAADRHRIATTVKHGAGGKLQQSPVAAAHTGEEYEYVIDQQPGANSEDDEEEVDHQNLSADEQDEQLEARVLGHKHAKGHQQPVKQVHFQPTPPSSRYGNDAPSPAATCHATNRNSRVNSTRSSRTAPPTAAALAASAADNTPPEFAFAPVAPKPSQAGSEAKAKVTQRSSATNGSKKRARAQEPQERYADLSSLQVTQQGDEEDDAAGGYVGEEEFAPRTAKRSVAGATDKAKTGNDSSKRAGSRGKGSVMKPFAHGSSFTGQEHGSRPISSSITQHSQQPKSSTVTRSATGKTGGRFGTMSVQSGMSMDRHYNAGVEVSSGRVSKSRGRANGPATEGNTATQRVGRMGPPAPRFNSNNRTIEAQQKADAAAKQSAAMDIFGSLGF